MAYIVTNGVTSNGIVLNGEPLTVEGGGSAVSITMNFQGSGEDSITVSEGGYASSITMAGSGFTNAIAVNRLNVYGKVDGVKMIGALTVAEDCEVFSGGSLLNLSGGADAQVGHGLRVNSGGYVSNIQLNDGHIGLAMANGATVLNLQTVSGFALADAGGLLSKGNTGILTGSDATYGNFYISGNVASNCAFTGWVSLRTATGNGTWGQWNGGAPVVGSGFTMSKTKLLEPQVSMYLLDGATAVDTVVSGGACIIGSRYAYMGETGSALVSKTTVREGGRLIVRLSNGVARETTIDKGTMIVSLGFAEQTTVNSDGSMYVSNGGTANSTTIGFRGNMHVSNGGAANSTTVSSWGTMHVSAGGTANSTTVDSGYFNISSGGTANGVTLNSYGYMSVYSGGTANSVTLNSAGWMYIFSGGILNSATVNDYSYLEISSGGTANSVTVSSAGSMRVSSGGTAIDAVIGAEGWLIISGGGKVTGRMTFENGAIVSSLDKGILDFDLTRTAPNSDALVNNLSLITGSPVYTLTVDGTQENGKYKLADGASGFNSTISVMNTKGNNLASISLDQGANISGTDYALSLSNGTLSLQIGSGGVSSSTSSGSSPQTSGGLVISGGSYVVSSGKTLENATVASGGGLIISNDGSANSTTISGGWLDVSSGGTVKSTTVDSAFSLMIVSSGGTADTTTINSNGCMLVSSGGTAINTKVSSGGNLSVQSGGMATNIDASSGGKLSLTVAPDTYIAGTSNGSAFELNGGKVSNYNVTDESDLTIGSGGTADNTIINSSGNLLVKSGGTANSTTVVNGGLIISQGGIANSATIDSTGYLNVSSGATARNIIILSGAYCFFAVSPDTYIAGTSNGSAFEFKDGKASNFVINNASLHVYGAGYAEKIVVNEKGGFALCNGTAKARDTIVNSGGNLTVFSGSANNTTIRFGANLYVYSGGKLTGRMIFENGAIVSAYSGGILDFDLTKTAPNSDALLNNFSLVTGSPVYTLTVDGTQENGKYKLAEVAAGFNSTISVVDTAGNTLGSLTVDGTLSVNNVNYTLTNQNGSLELQISRSSGPQDQDTVAPIISTHSISQGTGNYTFTVSVTATDNKTAVNNLAYSVKYAASTATLVNAFVISGSTFALTASDADKTYYYQAGVSDEAGNTAWSEVASFTVRDVTAPTLNGVPSVTVNGTSVMFSWNAANDNVGVAGYYLTVDNARYDLTETTYTVNHLSVGTHSFSLSAYDAAGNQSAETAKTSFSIASPADTVPPVISSHSISQKAGTYEFTVSVAAMDDRTSADKLVYLIRHATGAGALLSIEPTEGKTFTVTPEDVPMTHYYQIGVRDEAGNEAWSVTTAFKITDVTAPALRGTPSVSVNGKSATFSWSPASDNVEVTGYTLTVDNTKYEVSGTSYTVNDLAVGRHSFTLSAYDAAGNRSAQSAAVSFDVEEPSDTVVPVISNYSISQKAGTYEFTVSVAATDDKSPVNSLRYHVKCASTIAALANASALSGKTIALTDADAAKMYYYRIGVTDEAGNTAWSEPVSFTVTDVTVPMLNGAPVVTVNGQSATFIWSPAHDNVAVTGYTLTVDNTKYEVNGTSYTVNDLAVGRHSFTLSAYDAAGNRSAQSAAVSFDVAEPPDTTPPVISMYSISQGADNYVFTVSATATDDKSPVNSLRYQVKYASTIAALANASARSGMSFTLSESDAGKTYYYQAGVSDEAGNTAWSDAASFTVKSLTSDKIPPTISVSGNPTEWTNQKVTLTATFTDDESGSGIASKQYSFDNSSWKNYTKAITIKENKTIYFKATDKEGNTATETIDVTKIDTTKPVLGAQFEANYNALGNILNFSWDEATDENLAGYRLIVNGQTCSPVASPLETSYAIISPSGKYSYQLEAYDKAGNVSKSKTKTLTISLPDLTPSDLSITKKGKNATEFTTADVIILSFYVKNIGKGNISDISYAEIYDGTQRLGQIEIAALGAGKKQKYTYSINASALAAGSHQLTVKLNQDAYGIIESDKSNNSAISKSFTIKTKEVLHGNSTFLWSGSEYVYVQESGVKKSDFIVTTASDGENEYMWTDPKLIDAEKDSKTVKNYYLYMNTCWAATASNMFTRAGWSDGVFKTEDDVLAYFTKKFSLVKYYDSTGKYVGEGVSGGFTDLGVNWLLHGYNYDINWDLLLEAYRLKYQEDLSKPKSKKTGGFYKKANEECTESSDNNTIYQEFLIAMDKLKQGYSVGLGVTWNLLYQKNNTIYFVPNGGHAITVYGFTYDESKKGTPNYFTGIIVADSDDDKGSASNPNKKPASESPNRIKILSLTYDKNIGYIFNRYGYGFNTTYNMYQAGVISGFQYLPSRPDNLSGALSSNIEFSINDDWNASYSIGNSIQAALSGDRSERITTADDVFVALNLSNSDLGGSTIFTISAVIDGQEENALSFQIERNVQYGESISDTVIDLGKLSHGSHSISIAVQDGDRQDTIEIRNLYIALDTSALTKFTIEAGNNGIDLGLAAGEMLTVAGGGTATGSVIVMNSEQVVKANATALDTMIFAGMLTVENGGTVKNTNIFEGGFLVANGTVNATTIHSGGVLFADQNSDVSNTMIETDGWMDVNFHGAVANTDVHGNLFVTNGTADRNIIRAGGFCEVYDTGEMTGTTVENEGRQFVTSGGSAFDNTFTGWESEQYVLSNGTAEKNMFDGGVQMVVSAFVSDNEFRNYGIQELFEGAVAMDNRIYDTCRQNISQAFAYDTTIYAGGMSFVFEGSLSTNCTVKSGGYIVVGDLDGLYEKGVGAVRDLTVEYGGYAMLEDGAVLFGTNVVAGAMAVSGSVTGASTGIEDQSPRLVFDLSGRSVSDGYLISDLSLCSDLNFGITLTADQGVGKYSLSAKGAAAESEYLFTVHDKDGVYYGMLSEDSFVVMGDRLVSLESDGVSMSVSVTASPYAPMEMPASFLKTEDDYCSWGYIAGCDGYLVQLSKDGFQSCISVKVGDESMKVNNMPYDLEWRIKPVGSEVWTNGGTLSAHAGGDGLVATVKDWNCDLLFVDPSKTWDEGCFAMHTGMADGWIGVRGLAALDGKNKFVNVFEATSDASILILTDDANGDALFVEDLNSDLPESIAEQKARIAEIDEIRAGAGDDVVDMTSQLFDYSGSGLTIRGGSGNDTIWANKGNNALFGDAGDDNLVGASGDDLISGGSGNDSMHGGGGNDVFTFCENWGEDIIRQLDTGTVTLWFASGSKSKWDASSLTYTDGTNSVRLFGIAGEQITLKFGDDGSEEFKSLSALGAFADASSEKIFEESGKGYLA